MAVIILRRLFALRFCGHDRTNIFSFRKSKYRKHTCRKKEKDVSDKILVVDDEPEALKLFKRIVERNTPYKAETCQSGESALAIIKEEDIALIIADYRMPGMDGLELLKKVREINPDQLFIMITGYGTIEIAVEAMKMGAFDFITKPIGIDQVLFSMQRAVDWQKLKKENIFLRQVSRVKRSLDIVGESSAIREVLSSSIRFPAQTVRCLLSVKAEQERNWWLAPFMRKVAGGHGILSPLIGGPFPRSLIESELFGHRKGAFTGATMHKRGMLSKADGGTVFLDEIGDIPLSIQAKLLRFIQESEFKLVGSLQPQDVDARILAATNKELETLIKEGHFREDLYYRLNVFKITIPPLRDRKEDIALLARYFLGIYASQLKKR